MKKAVLLVSKRFPASHERCGELTGFREKLLKGKIHTIRENGNYWQKKAKLIESGEAYLSIREWTGKPYCSPQAEILQLPKVGVQTITMSWTANDTMPVVCIDGKQFFDLKTPAANDGLEQSDFLSWFFATKNDFQGVILHFTEFRY